ncbi:MAG TPA: phosphate ABC transporter permease subunit PstC [Solirubrobacteraceae bacterium]|nr:phosphate ABC transporter permease subunit PstC [Solirubrobacteraceae bacterium]
MAVGVLHRPGRGATAGIDQQRAVKADRRAELTLGALGVGVLALIGLMLVTVLINAWPSFSANGLSWFGSGGEVVTQFRAMQSGTPLPGHSVLYFRAWPLIWGTLITTVPAALIALVVSTLAAIFLIEFAPASVRRVLEPVVRLLAGIPSVVYGLFGILVLVPYVNEHLISNARKASVEHVVQLNGADLFTATLVLTLMILPIMIAISAGALSAVPPAWREGSAALGVNRWRTMWRVSVRTARPAIAAGLVLATARALGEAIMLSMLSGGRPFAANPLDGLTFFFEPVQPLAATIVKEFGGQSGGPVASTIYAIAAVLLFSAALLSLAAWAVKQPLKRYGIGA